MSEMDEKARADAAEKKIEEMHKMLVQQEGVLAQAWALREETIKERVDDAFALRAALRLLAYLIKENLRGLPE